MAQRRSTDELKKAIYQATIDLLENDGYEKITFQNVAKRAETTRSVIYRYWENPSQLIFEAARFVMTQNAAWRGSVVDQNFNNGDLRSDLIEMLKFMQVNFSLYPKNFLPYLFFEQARGKTAFSERVDEITVHNLVIMERILARAQERGEARENIAQAAKLLAFQSSRYHIMIDGSPMTNEQIDEYVDDVLLPLYLK